MQSRWLVTNIALVMLMATPAFAQTSNPSTSTNTQTSPQAQNQSLPQAIRQKLEKQGFTNVQIVPGSFIVSAKDKDGDPVNMVIGPNSMMVMTTSQVRANPDSGQTNNK